MPYKNYRCYAYHLYGDNSGREYSFQQLKEYFEIDGSENARCIKDKIGDPQKREYFSFSGGKFYRVDITNAGTFVIR